MANVPLSNGSYQDLAAAVSNGNDVRVLGQKDAVNRRAHAWIQNRKHTWCAVVGGVSDCPYTWDNSRLSGHSHYFRVCPECLLPSPVVVLR